MLKIKNTKKFGRGVYAENDIGKNKLIEVSPLVVISNKKDIKSILNTILGHYVYSYKNDKCLALAGGVGSFFNHNVDANVHWVFDEKKQIAKYYTTRKIKKGEQLFLNYGYEPL
jgi:SET domain-containing protein